MYSYFFFNDTATTEIYTLSLHDALPISPAGAAPGSVVSRLYRYVWSRRSRGVGRNVKVRDRKSTRLNSSHGYISYAVFCLKKKKSVRRLQIHRDPVSKRPHPTQSNV